MLYIYYLFIFVHLINQIKSDFLIDQRYKEKEKQNAPQNPFFNTFYDKSYYGTGAQRPVYNVNNFFNNLIKTFKF